MKFNIVCMKFDQKINKKTKCWTFQAFKVFLNLKKSRFFWSHFPALEAREVIFLRNFYKLS